MNYYKRHIGDYLKDTSHLTLLEHGVYTRLLDVYYTRESGIPDEQAARLIGARAQEEKEALAVVLSEFFVLDGGIWSQTRCEREIDAMSEKVESNRENGRKGGRPRKEETQTKPNGNPLGFQEEPNGNPNQTHEEPKHNPSHKPLAISHKPEGKTNTRAPRFDAQAHLESLGVMPDVAADWLELRKKKRLASTRTAFEGVREEAEKAQMSMNDALRICCARGWGGFDSSWLKDRHQPNAPPQQRTYHDERADVIAGLTGRNRPQEAHEPSDRITIDAPVRLIR